MIYTKPDWDIRLYTPVARGTEEYQQIYKKRTCTERINNRILNDYGLHRMVLHTVKRYSFITTIIALCIHLDALCVYIWTPAISRRLIQIKLKRQ